LAAVDRPLKRLEQMLEGLRLSALETARLYEARADILGGVSRVDHLQSAKRWRAIADQASDLSAALRESSRRAPRPSPVVPVVDTDATPATYDVRQPATDAMDHLRAARLNIDVVLASPGQPARPELRGAVRDLERAVHLLREIAVEEGLRP
jgi:hypothetical protein